MKITKFENPNQLKSALAGEYQKTINNYFGDEKKALKFLSSVVSAVQKNPDLMNCEPVSLINSFMTMAELELMPSDASGEAYVIPYKKGEKLEAQFQLGYQGLVTLFYRAGAKSIVAEIVYEKDGFSYKNGKVKHTCDPFSNDRGDAIGAYVIIQLGSGGEQNKVMKKEEILEIAKKYSKSYASKFSPWSNDPQLWMWKKTVLKQAAKLVPKNENIYKAVASDNEDSIIGDRLEEAKAASEQLKMGNLIENGKKTNKEAKEDKAEDKATESKEGQEA